MFEKILYPTDFSDVSQKALDYIKQLQGAGTKEVVLLHVINQRIVDSLSRHAVADEAVERWLANVKDGARQSLEEIETELSGCGFHTKSLLKTGVPLKEILKVEDDERVSLVILGSHGRTNLEEVFLGSVSEKVVRRCKSPVLVIKR